MTTVVDSLRGLGFTVGRRGNDVWWQWEGTGSPDPNRAKPLFEELKAEKSAVLELLHQEETDSFDVVHIHSRILETDLYVVPNDWTGELDGLVYADREVRELDRLKVTPDELRKIHAAKTATDGVIEPDAQPSPTQ